MHFDTINKKRILASIVLILIAVLWTNQVDAQCAMCKINAENASKDNQGFAEGLNNGILYLMGIPYLLLGIGGIIFYKKVRRGTN